MKYHVSKVSARTRCVGTPTSNSSSAWKIPLLLCRHLEIVCIPPAFDLYQKDLPTDVAEKLEGVIIDSLCMRLYLFKWMSCGPDFKDRHPLNELHVRYAGIENLANIYDTIAFHHLAHAVTHVPGAKRSWIKGEARLLQYKLMQRPDMYVDICRIAQIHPPSFKNALGALDQVVESSYLRISQSTDPRYNSESRAVKVAMAVHRELQIYARHEHGDHRAHQRTRNDIATADRRHIPLTLTDPNPMHALDIEDCAPLCMKQNLRDMRGSVPQQATMSHQRRYYVAHYLLELGHDKGELVQLMRPRNALEYEMERPKVPLADIPQLVAQADRERTYNLTEHDSHVRSCETLMLAGHCPHQPAVSSNRHSMSPEQKGAENRHRYRAAKEACHSRLVNIWARRKSQQLSAGREVKMQWTKSPYCFTQVALKGAGANIDA